jgi:16S rRNA (cytosine967-C5)-methyltransferase
MNSRQAFIFNHFKNLITSYDGSLPFHYFFKKYCKFNTALGSKDRRILREIIYSIYRLGPAWKGKFPEDLFLLPNTKDADELLKTFYAELEQPELDIAFEYPFSKYLMSDLLSEDYYESLQVQPLVWVRVNHVNALKFKEKYVSGIVTEEQINDKFTAFGLKNNTVIEPDSFPIEVQDLSSQLVSSKIEVKDGMKVWDCCSGAGGKSLFLAEASKNLKLYVSDIRPTILENLKARFKQNRLPIPKMATSDLSKKPEKINFSGEIVGRDSFDVIIADVPCSGSGTWGREPENLTYFKPDKIDEMAVRQVNIVKSTLRFLKHGGKLYYITCSVFEKENFGVLKELEDSGLVKVVSAEMVYGYNKQADSLFIAELQSTSRF